MDFVQMNESNTKCHLCHQAVTKDALKSGQLYQLLAGSEAELSCHYFCLLFSNQGLQQWGEDWEGILGFREPDIRKEVVRGQTIFCYRCGRNGATIRCQGDQCSLYYHYSCGATAAPEHVYIFQGEYPSFCWQHAPRQQLQHQEAMSCLICHEDLESWGPGPGRLVTPCCLRALHRDCVQETATHAGVLNFRCPACNNEKRFREEMRQHGIYVPHAESTWENEDDFYHFSDLEQEFSIVECDADVCWSRRSGEESNAKFEVMKCSSCSGQSVHLDCVGLEHGQVHTCTTCRTCGGQEATGGDKSVADCPEKLLLSHEKESCGSLEEFEVREEAMERRQMSLMSKVLSRSRSLKRRKCHTIVKFVPDSEVVCHFREEIPRKKIVVTHIATQNNEQSLKKSHSAGNTSIMCDAGDKNATEQSKRNKVLFMNNKMFVSEEECDEISKSKGNKIKSFLKASRKKNRSNWAVLSTGLTHIPTQVLQDQKTKGSTREGFAIYRRLTCRLCQRTFHKSSGLSMHICFSLKPPSRVSPASSHLMPPPLVLPTRKRQLFASPSAPRPPLPGLGHGSTAPAAAGRPCCNCAGCVLPDCGQCEECLEKKKFGGTGRLEKLCSLRQCSITLKSRWREVTVEDLQSNIDD